MNFWQSGFVSRWHTNPHFNQWTDYTCAHSGRVAQLMLWLNSDVSKEALAHAVTHDLGEQKTGDLAYPFKRANPELTETLADAEQEAIRDMGFDIPELSVDEMKLFKLCDRLDSYLWAIHHKPEYVKHNAAWQNLLHQIMTEAFFLNVIEKVDAIIEGVKNDGF